jgi:hypothetical protein
VSQIKKRNKHPAKTNKKNQIKTIFLISFENSIKIVFRKKKLWRRKKKKKMGFEAYLMSCGKLRAFY